MMAVDTNVLVRFLVRDDERQAELVRKRFSAAEARREVLFVSLLVILETLWVLESVYAIPREDILASIGDLMMMPIFEIEALPAVQGFASSARQTRGDLSDVLIGHAAKLAGCSSVLTFDKTAAKMEMFKLIT